jgi:uncharacterized membrane protein (DUF4010 family)
MPDITLDTASELWRLAVALAIGLVLGAEREQRKGDGPERSAAGVRTFASVAVLGGVASLLGVAAVTVFALFVGGAALASYLAGDRSDPGLTTEIALVLCFALGVLSAGRPALALAVAVATAALLAARGPLHAFVRDTLSERELRDALVLGVAALVVLPMVPDRFMGPLKVVNPYILWKLAVVMMGLTAAGYVAQRIVGASMGLAVAGLAGGFVSSSVHAGAVAGACASTVATFVQLAIVIALADSTLSWSLALPLAAGGVTAGAYSAVRAWKAARARGPPVARGRAFGIWPALLFASLVGGVGLLAAFAQAQFGQVAVPITAAIAGFADAHATAASAASLHAAGRVSEPLAVYAVLLALSTNTVTKAVLAFTSGTRRFAWEVSLGLILVLASTWGGLIASRMI